MIIGCVKERKLHEYRVGCTPAGVAAYVAMGHTFILETKAGENSGFSDKEYQEAGAEIVESADKAWKNVDMMIKVKEPIEEEYCYFREGLILFTYLHLAANEILTKELMKSKMTAIAYETLSDGNELPLLKPMSEVAGKLSLQEAAKYLEKPFGGRGVLLGGVAGVERGKVVILGGGVVGTSAAKSAIGLGARVVILDTNVKRLSYLEDIFGNTIQTLYSTDFEIERQCSDADVVIGAVLIPGATAPKLLKHSYLKNMKKGSVIVDVAVDQGGCFETTKPTNHEHPTFVIDGVVHYCVANMPGAVPHTSTLALTNATLPYGLQIANTPVQSLCENAVFASAMNTYAGHLTCQGVADALGIPYTSLSTITDR